MSSHDTVAIGISLVASVFDLHSRRIPNLLTFGAALAALIVSPFTTGLSGLGFSAAGWLLATVLWLPLYALGGMGAADVKLLAAIGAWLGPADVLHAALYAAIAGGILGIMVAYAHGCVRETWSNVQLLIVHWRVVGFAPHAQLTLATSTSPRLAYAVPILIGTTVAIWFR